MSINPAGLNLTHAAIEVNAEAGPLVSPSIVSASVAEGLAETTYVNVPVCAAKELFSHTRAELKQFGSAVGVVVGVEEIVGVKVLDHEGLGVRVYVGVCATNGPMYASDRTKSSKFAYSSFMGAHCAPAPPKKVEK